MDVLCEPRAQAELVHPAFGALQFSIPTAAVIEEEQPRYPGRQRTTDQHIEPNGGPVRKRHDDGEQLRNGTGNTIGVQPLHFQGEGAGRNALQRKRTLR